MVLTQQNITAFWIGTSLKGSSEWTPQKLTILNQNLKIIN